MTGKSGCLFWRPRRADFALIFVRSFCWNLSGNSGSHGARLTIRPLRSARSSSESIPGLADVQANVGRQVRRYVWTRTRRQIRSGIVIRRSRWSSSPGTFRGLTDSPRLSSAMILRAGARNGFSNFDYAATRASTAFVWATNRSSFAPGARGAPSR